MIQKLWPWIPHPTPNMKPVSDKGGGLTGGATGACVNGNGAPVLNENVAPPEVEDVAWMVDNPNANCTAEVITPPPLNGLDAGAGMVSKFKPVLLPAVFVTFFLLTTKAGVCGSHTSLISPKE
jgi:hypothetical protein